MKDFISRNYQKLIGEKSPDFNMWFAAMMLLLMFPLFYVASFVISTGWIALLACTYFVAMYFALDDEYELFLYTIGLIIWTIVFLLLMKLSGYEGEHESGIQVILNILLAAPWVLIICWPMIASVFATVKGPTQNYMDHGDDGGSGE